MNNLDKGENPFGSELPEETSIEPQVQQAAATLEAKGYRIGNIAGQCGRLVEKKQGITFDFPKKGPGENNFDDATLAKLKAIGVRQYSGALPVDMIGLEFDGSDDFEAVEAKWKQIADILPRVAK